MYAELAGTAVCFIGGSFFGLGMPLWDARIAGIGIAVWASGMAIVVGV